MSNLIRFCNQQAYKYVDTPSFLFNSMNSPTLFKVSGFKHFFAVWFYTLLLCTSSYAQITVWEVDFETGYIDDAETAQDNNSPAGADWTKSGTPSNWWRVENDNALAGSFSMSGRNTDGVMTWTSESISIANFSDVSISIDIAEVSCEGADIIETFYNTGGGDIEFGDGNGDGDFNTATNTVTGLSGSNLTITVTLNNNGGGERLIFDNITVQGTYANTNGHLGPGGVGDTDGAGNLEFWYIAEGESFADGDLVGSVNDRSGNSHTLSAAGGERPLFSDNAVNGQAAFTFNLDDELEATTYQGNSNENMSFGMALRYVADGGLNVALQHGGRNTMGFTSGNLYTDFVGGANHISSTAATANWTYHAKTFANSGADRLKYYVNNSNTDNFTHTIENRTSNTWIGGHGSGGGTGLKGDIAEVYKFAEVLNAAQQIIIANYMAAKYAIPLASNNLYDHDDPAGGNYDFDVAGIGQASDGSFHADAQGTGIIRINDPADLEDAEFLIWGHDNGALSSFGVTDLPSGVEGRLSRTWRFSETGDVGSVSISVDLGNVFGSKIAADIRLLIDSDNDGEFADEVGPAVVSGAVNTIGDVFEWTNVEFSDSTTFTFGSVNTGQTPLPIKLMRFGAEFVSDHVEVQWTTASEVNSDYFEIEKTKNGKDVTTVQTMDAAGTSRNMQHYSIIDRSPFEGKSYYRLVQFDKDGTYEAFDWQEVNNASSSTNGRITAFPNPTDNTLELHSEDELAFETMQLTDLRGSNVNHSIRVLNSDQYRVQLDVSRLAPGTYFILISGKNVVKFFKN